MYSTNPTPRKQRNEAESFDGFLKDESLKFMAIDSFDWYTRSCKVFLLSHHHTDHMSGLQGFVKELHQSTDQFIFTSPLTAEYIKNSYRIDSSKIQELPINKSFVVYTLTDGSDVTVTSVPSGHCPGAVMFVIEYKDKRILYTGDMRMNLDEFKKSQKYLMISENCCRKIDDLYLDSTFAVPESDTMPHRDLATDSILNFAEEWLLDGSPKKKIILQIHTCIGCEYLYISLAKKFKTKIVVHQDEFDKFYAGVEELVGYFKVVNDLVEDENWKIHACFNKVNECNGRLCEKSFETRVIKPTALGFVNKFYFDDTDSNDVEYMKKDNWVGKYTYSFVAVYYSHHSSLEELKSIVKFVNPTNLYLNTVYKEREEEMYKLFSTEIIKYVSDGRREKCSIDKPKIIDSARDGKGDRLHSETHLENKKRELRELEKILNLW